MVSPYTDIFSHAAIPQKMMFLAFLGMALLAASATVCRPINRFRGVPSLVAALRLTCPMLGVLCAALNCFHMMQTTLRLPFEPTAKMLAPGVMEMTALVAAGALAGLVATLSHGYLRAHARWKA